MSPSWSLGDRTPVREPDPTRYGAFRIVDAIKGEAGLVTLSVEAMYGFDPSEFLRMGRRGCPLDVQVHFGQCQDPRDFNAGWDKVFVLEGADIGNWGTNDMGALQQGEESTVLESIDFNALDAYEIKPLLFAELGEAEIIGEVMAVSICDAVSCGECGIPSTGCQVVFAITEHRRRGGPRHGRRVDLQPGRGHHARGDQRRQPTRQHGSLRDGLRGHAPGRHLRR